MKTVDAIPVRDQFHKLTLIEDEGQFSIVRITCGRPAITVQEHMTPDAAKSYWRRMCMAFFYKATHNIHDSESMTDRRLQSITIH